MQHLQMSKQQAFGGVPFAPYRDAVMWAIKSLNYNIDYEVSAIHIRNTLHLDELWLTPNLLKIVDNCIQIKDFKPLAFNGDESIDN